MFLYRSNRSERLVDALAEVLRAPQRNPLAPEIVVVQSKGMERWLALELSQRLSVCANVQFPFPRHLLWQLSERLLGEERPAAAAFEQRALGFAIAALLPSLLGRPELEPLARYLEGDAGSARLIELAQRIARVFDDYAVYRPDLLAAFERGRESGWEPVLWRAVVERHGRGHQAARAERMLAALAVPAAAERLPQRLCLFGISSLPPLYVELISELAKHVETHLFVLSPCRAYFADVRARRVSGPIADTAEEGHPLLASLGRLGRELQQVLEEHAHHVEREIDDYVDPGTGTLLQALQSDVLELRDRGAPRGEVAPRVIAGDDASLSIHVCHSPMREIEVLHDQLVQVLEDPSIEPHDIVVMAPDIESYAPVIEAVFGQHSGRPQLPFSVADRKTRRSHEAIDALYALLGVVQGRMTAAEVLDLLSLTCVRRRFDIASEELDTLRAWVEQSGIRWGVDAEHRVAVGQPAFVENTFRFGLDRMLLGYALDGEGERLFAGVLPLDGIEGSAADLLGRFAELCERLFAARAELSQPRTLGAWREALLSLMEGFLDDAPSTLQERGQLQAALAALAQAADQTGFDREIELRTLGRLLESALDERLPARGLLAGGITFCQLVPLRNIPFQVVCLIGMNDQAFPGADTRLGFDRMAEPGQRRAGDRNRRDDDRYMFLEALLSARQRVLISYVGRGVHDNRVMPPSVVVGELLDAVARGFTPEGRDSASPLERRKAIEERLCTQHRLHAFSPHYFERRSPLFSYARHYCEGARVMGGERAPARGLLSGPLQVTDELRELTIEELVSWLTTPIRNLLQRELGVHLGEEVAPLPPREPLELDGLSRWQLGDDLLARALERGVDLRELLPAARARGALPLGTVGAFELGKLEADVGALAGAAALQREGAALPPLPVDFELDGVRLTGTLRRLWPEAQLCVSFSRIGRRFELVHFIRHVVLCHVLDQDPRLAYPRGSVVVARGTGNASVVQARFEPVAEPAALLHAWLEIVRAARRAPLPFEHDTSRACAEALIEDGEVDGAKRAARKAFDDEFSGANDGYVRLAYPSFDTLLAAPGPLGFAQLAREIFAPFFAHRKLL